MHKKTNIDMSIGDAIDRLTIIIRKIQYGEDGAIKEMEYLADAIGRLKIPLSGALLAAIIRLTYCNFEVWNLENKFRRGEDMPAELVKEMMIKVRDFNSRRVYNKNEINRMTQMGFREFKIQHRSR